MCHLLTYFPQTRRERRSADAANIKRRPASANRKVLLAVCGKLLRLAILEGAPFEGATPEGAASAFAISTFGGFGGVLFCAVTGAGACRSAPFASTPTYFSAATPLPLCAPVIRSGESSHKVTTFMSSSERCNGNLSEDGSTANTDCAVPSVIFAASAFG